MTTVPGSQLSDGVGSRVRLLFSVLGCLGAAIAVTGLAAHELFDQPTSIKYGISVAAPVLVILMARVSRPVEATVPVAIVLAPFSNLVFTFSGVSVSLFAILLFLAVVTVIFDKNEELGPSSTGQAAVLAFALLIPALLIGKGSVAEVRLILTAGIVAWVTAAAVRRKSGLTAVVAAMAITVALQGGLAIYEFTTKSQINFYGSHNSAISSDYFFNFAGTDRAVGSFSDPISLGNVFAVTLPLLVAALAVCLAGRNRWGTFLLVAAIVLSVIGLGVTLSRTSWIAATVGTVLACLSLGRPWRARILIGLAVIVAVPLIAISKLAGPALGLRFASVFDPTSSSVATAAEDRTREQLWDAAANTFLHHPVFGVGAGNLRQQLEERVANVGTFTHAHNTYLQVAAESGIAGLLGLAILAAGVILDLLSMGAERAWRAGLIGSLVAILVCWVTDYTFSYLSVVASIAPVFGIAAGLASVGKSARRPPVPVQRLQTADVTP